MDRRNFLRWLCVAAASGVTPRVALAADDDLYDVGRFGNVRILHLTDTHAQLQPVYFREPSVNIGVGDMRGKPPHIVGGAFLEYFNIAPGGRAAHAFTFLDYQDAAHRYGRMGGFAHLKTLIDRLRTEAGAGNSLLLDGGDIWQGTGLANASQGADMVEAANLLGVDAMAGHWEFTYGEATLRKNLASFKGEFWRRMFFDRGRRLQRQAGVRSEIRPRLQAGDGERGRRHARRRHRPSLSLVPSRTRSVSRPMDVGIREQELQKLVDDLRNAQHADAWCYCRITAWTSI